MADQRKEVGAADADDVEAGTVQRGEQDLFGVTEEVGAFDGRAVDRARLGEMVERPDAGGEVIEAGEIFEVTAIAAEQDLAQITEAVDVFLSGARARVVGPCRCYTLR